MKGVYQQKRNDCTAACLASVFEIPLEEVPELPDAETWIAVLNVWLRTKNLYSFCVSFEEKDQAQDCLKGYTLGAIKSKNILDKLHSVVCKDAKIIWDPIKGIQESTEIPINWLVFGVLDPSKKVVI